MTEPEAAPEEAGMTFWEHLEELRSRLVRAVIAMLVGGTVAWIYREEVLVWLTVPFIQAWSESIDGQKASLHFPAPAALFLAYVKLSLLSGLVVSSPVIFYQLWSFIAPGLYAREKRWALPFVAVSTGLFAGGSYFGYKVAFPMAFKYLLGMSGPLAGGDFEVKPTVMIGDYIEFVSRMLIAFGAAFELPVVIFFLTIAGVVNHVQLLRFSRYFVVLAFLVAALITPPDIMSQFLLAIPLCILYFGSVLVAWLFGRRRAAKQSASAALDGANDDPG